MLPANFLCRALPTGFLLAFTMPTLALAVGLQTIALTGQSAPGGPEGALFQEFGISQVNNVGDVEFLGAMLTGTAGVTVDDAIGIWTASNGTITPVTVGDPSAPGIPGAMFETIGTAPQFSDTGAVLAEFQLESGVGGVTTNDDFAGWLFHSTGDRLLYREGSSLPGLPPDAQLFFSDSRLNANGDIALLARFRAGFGGVTTANDRGLWIDTGGGMQMIARSGDPAQGGPAGAVYDGFGAPVLNDNAVIASSGALRTGLGGVTANDADVVYTNRSGPFAVAYREGGTATGTAVFDFFSAVRLNNDNRLAFVANLKQGIGGVNSFNSQGIWVETGTGLRQVVRTDDIMPGIGGSKFRGLLHLAVNDIGRVAFAGSSTSTITFNTIYSEGIDGQLALVARAFTAAPDTGPGVNFDFDQTDFTGIPKLMINNRGQVAFFAGLTGTGVTTANDMGLWAQDTSGLLKLIVRKGNQIEVAPSDLRTVQTFRFGNMSQQGQIVFDAMFTDGTSGVFVSNLVAQLLGDFDGDADVDGRDFLAWQRGQSPNPLSASDLADWQANYGTGSLVAASVSVPEPTSLALFLMAIIAECAKRRIARCTGLSVL